MAKRILIFLLINFFALYLGGVFTGSGVTSEWYQSLYKAPWTPPGWVFGFAWTLIMISFSIYMALLFRYEKKRNRVITLFSLQWILNVLWSVLFFYFKEPLLGMLDILVLTIIIGFFLVRYKKDMNFMSLWILPYFTWLLLATSLNGYILLFN